MSSGQYNGFVIEQGAAFRRTLEFFDSNGDTIDIQNNIINMELRECPGAEVALLISTEGVDPFIVINIDNTASINVPSTTTDTLEALAYDYDLFRDDLNTIFREMRGSIPVRERITQ